MLRLDVRRLAAIDMYGTIGARWRRRVIVAEFIAGAAVSIALGPWLVLGSRTVGGRLFGAWLTGVGVNYLVLALHAVSLSRSGALDTELAGLDVRAELRHYSLAQLWVAIPLTVAVFAIAQLVRPTALESWVRSTVRGSRRGSSGQGGRAAPGRRGSPFRRSSRYGR
jgi:hypothetical protein